MKRLAAWALALLMILSLSACKHETKTEGTQDSFDAEALISALEAQLEVEHIEDRTVIRLGELVTNPTALLEAKGMTEVSKVHLVDWYLGGKDKEVFAASLEVTAKEGNLIVGDLYGRISYENGTYTLTEMELSGSPPW